VFCSLRSGPGPGLALAGQLRTLRIALRAFRARPPGHVREAELEAAPDLSSCSARCTQIQQTRPRTALSAPATASPHVATTSGKTVKRDRTLPPTNGAQLIKDQA